MDDGGLENLSNQISIQSWNAVHKIHVGRNVHKTSFAVLLANMPETLLLRVL